MHMVELVKSIHNFRSEVSKRHATDVVFEAKPTAFFWNFTVNSREMRGHSLQTPHNEIIEVKREYDQPLARVV